MKSPYRTATTVAVVCLMALGLMTLSASAWGAPPAPGFHSPTPLVDEISPTAARLGSGGFILTLRGAGFRPGAEIGWQVGATTRRLAAFVCSPSEIVTWIPYSLVNKAATATVTVINPDTPLLVGKSNPVFLPITVPTSGLAFTEKNTTLGEVLNSIVTADFNGDGKPDLAVTEPCGTDIQCNTYHGSIAILLGRAMGLSMPPPPRQWTSILVRSRSAISMAMANPISLSSLTWERPLLSFLERAMARSRPRLLHPRSVAIPTPLLLAT
jgi:hypothetical protein